MQSLAPNRHQHGLSLIDSLIALCVTSVAFGAAMPGFSGAIERRHLDGAAAQLETDIQFARSLAVAQNRNVRLSVSSTTAGSCYVVYAGKANDCKCSPLSQTQCVAGIEPWRNVAYAAGSQVQLKSNVGSMVFDPTLGTSTPTGTLRFTGTTGREVRLVVNIAGRVRTCTPSADVRGYAKC